MPANQRKDFLVRAILAEEQREAFKQMLREVIRVRQKGEKIELEQCYILGKNDRELRVECRLNFYRHWTLLKAAYPLAACCSLKAGAVTALAESAYGTLQRQIHPQDSAEYYMHRFVDLQDEAGAGLYVMLCRLRFAAARFMRRGTVRTGTTRQRVTIIWIRENRDFDFCCGRIDRHFIRKNDFGWPGVRTAKYYIWRTVPMTDFVKENDAVFSLWICQTCRSQW